MCIQENLIYIHIILITCDETESDLYNLHIITQKIKEITLINLAYTRIMSRLGYDNPGKFLVEINEKENGCIKKNRQKRW